MTCENCEERQALAKELVGLMQRAAMRKNPKEDAVNCPGCRGAQFVHTCGNLGTDRMTEEERRRWQTLTQRLADI